MIWLLPGLLVGLAGGLAVAWRWAAASKRRIAEWSRRAARAEDEARSASRLAEVGTLTGVLAHEIKNPLSTIGLNLQLLQEDLQNTDGDHDRLRSRLSTVQRETNRLRDVLDDFLRFAGKLELDRKPTDLNRLLEELVDFFTPQTQQQRVQIRLRPTPGVICEVDEKTIKQAVLNLMINAVQAMAGSGGGSGGGGGGELILSVRAEADGQAAIDVIDTGPGIQAEVLDKVFQAYYSTKRGGSGLGLAMARRIAVEHGGSLTVRSEPGKGSDFTLRLPMKVEHAPTS